MHYRTLLAMQALSGLAFYFRLTPSSSSEGAGVACNHSVIHRYGEHDVTQDAHQALNAIKDIASTLVTRDSAAAVLAYTVDSLYIRFMSVRELRYSF